jgi:hypothetical protein
MRRFTKEPLSSHKPEPRRVLTNTTELGRCCSAVKCLEGQECPYREQLVARSSIWMDLCQGKSSIKQLLTD